MEALLTSSEIGIALRLSLRPFALPNEDNTHFAITEESKIDPTNPRLRKLIEAIIFSRRFVVSYYLVIGGILAVLTAFHWSKRYRRWRTASITRLPHTAGHSTPTSTSSTLLEVEYPPHGGLLKAASTEETPLLGLEHGVSSTPRTRWESLKSSTRSILMYQPAPIPALTSPTNHLPTNGTTILVLLFLGVNIFYLFFRTPVSIPMLFAFADRAGLCFVANIPVLYILAAKNQPVKFLTGWSYEGLNIFHRRLGEWMTILATFHSVGMFGVWYTLLRPAHFTLLRFISSKLGIFGLLAFSAYLAIYITSTGYFRHLFYETFLGLHIVLQVGALIFLFFHHHNARPYVIASLAIWAFDRLVSRIAISTKSVVATLQIAEDGDTVLVHCQVPMRVFMSAIRSDITNGWQPGQHVFVTIPGIGWKHCLQAHPFSIASPAPPASVQSGEWPLELIIRAKDGFSKELLAYAKFHQHTRVLLDGPYGSTEALDELRHADRKCLIAGGSGIAVTNPLAWDIMVKANDRDALVSTRVVYDDGRKVVPNFTHQPASNNDERFAHLWIKSSSKHESWMTLLPKSDALNVRDDLVKIEDGNTLSVASLITDSLSTQAGSGVEAPRNGRPDMAWTLKNWVESTGQGPDRVARKAEMICVVVSGPDGLVRDVRNAASLLVKDGWNIVVFVEKFGW